MGVLADDNAAGLVKVMGWLAAIHVWASVDHCYSRLTERERTLNCDLN